MKIYIKDIIACNRCGILLSKNYINKYRDIGKYLDTDNSLHYMCPFCHNEMTEIGVDKNE